MPSILRVPCAILCAAILSGCASLPPSRGYDDTLALVEARRDLAPAWPARIESRIESPESIVDLDTALRLGLAHHPLAHEQYARLGMSRADLEDARRLPNPRLGYSRRASSEGGHEISRRLSLGLGDVLLAPLRKRVAEGELEREQQAAAAALLELATRIEGRWYRAVAAAQVAAMRGLVAQSADQAARLAERFHAAGNISRLQLEQERAAAAQAGIAHWRAEAEALRARAAVAEDTGLSLGAPWRLPERLPEPLVETLAPEHLTELADEQRLDLMAARKAVQVREQALGLVRRWRWFGDLELEYERESEADGGHVRGPGLALELPLFNQGQGDRLRAEVQLHAARARYEALRRSVRDATRLHLDQVEVAARIARHYRDALVPQREAIVARTQEQVNYMLVGVFELIAARQQEFDAYQEYLEAVRDFWVARAELRGVVGGKLPGAEAMPEPSLGVEAILPGVRATTAGDARHQDMDHSNHEGMDHSRHQDMDHSRHESTDPPRDEPRDHSDHDGGDTAQPAAPKPAPHPETDHSRHEGMEHSRHENGARARPAAHPPRPDASPDAGSPSSKGDQP